MNCRVCSNPLPPRNEGGMCRACLHKKWARDREKKVLKATCSYCGARHGRRREKSDEHGEPNPRIKVMHVSCFVCEGGHYACLDCAAKTAVARGMLGEAKVRLKACPKEKEGVK